jgi:primosomal protein N' (replication factor Y)
MYFLQVAVPLPLYGLFTYKSDVYVDSGCRIKVNFNNQNIIGLVLDCSESNNNNYPDSKIKYIDEIIDFEPYIDKDSLKLIKFTSEYQHSPIGMIVDLSQPTALRKGLKACRQPIYAYKLLNYNYKTRSDKQQKILKLLNNQTVSLAEFKGLNVHIPSLKVLEQKQVVLKFDLNSEINTDIFKNLQFNNKHVLNNEQQSALNEINNANGFKVFLLHGVTGSGKTEVYMQAIENVLKRKQQVLIMVPEIGLTPQTIERFHNHFNIPIAAMHSALSERERLDNYLACRDGRIGILIGTRSSVFTPFKSLGMIIIDEEHDSSYKQQDTCRYNGKYIAIYKAKISNCPIVLGSATPSLESIYNCKIGKYQLLKLNSKAFVNHGKVIETIIDIRNSVLQAGLSDYLINAMQTELQQGNQVLIFLNKRGFANRVVCNDCGYVFKCKFCDSFLTYHKTKNILNCHHCEANYNVPSICPNCNSANFSIIGNGTEQIEEFLKQRFPDYPVVRIDRDSTSSRGKLDSYIEDIKNNKFKILIGTQILSKGHHFPNVTLVGLINVDQSLYSNDFRATEQLAQLYTQVAGRTGREEKDGKVLIQSYSPNNLILQTIIGEGYEKFVDYCLNERKYLNLPPFSYQALVRISSSNKETMNNCAYEIFNTLQKISRDPSVTVEPPRSAVMEKKQNKFHVLIMIQSNKRKNLSLYLDNLVKELANNKINKKTEIYIDIDPTEVLQ